MPARLIIEEGDLKGLVFALEEGAEWVLGRDPDQSQFVLEDSSVSRKHVQIKKQDDQFMISVLATSNPIQINGKEVIGEIFLRDGDCVRIGQHDLIFYEDQTLSLGNEGRSSNFAKNNVEYKDQDTIFNVDSDALEYLELELLDLGRWVLKIMGGTLQGAEFTLDAEKSYVLGNDPKTCDIVLHDRTISKNHAKISFLSDGSVQIEDLTSRNGIVVEGKKIEGAELLVPNQIFFLGTTSLILIDRELPAETLCSPLPFAPLSSPEPTPSELTQNELEKENALQKQEASEHVDINAEEEAVGSENNQEDPSSIEELDSSLKNLSTLPAQEAESLPKKSRFGKLLVYTLLIASVCGGGSWFVYHIFNDTKEEQNTSIDIQMQIDRIMKNFPSVSYQYQPETKKLRLWDHILTQLDHEQLLYQLQAVKEIRGGIENAIIIDELIWKENNYLIASNPNWKNITLIAPVPKEFVLSGNLKTKREMEALLSYLKQNFNYMDLLDNQVLVEEEVVARIFNLLQENSLEQVNVQLREGEVWLMGVINPKDRVVLEQVISQIRRIPGLKNVLNNTTEAQAKVSNSAFLDVTDSYAVTGYFQKNNSEINVVINGKIFSVGNQIDGYLISEIRNDIIILEKNGLKYKIDYKKS